MLLAVSLAAPAASDPRSAETPADRAAVLDEFLGTATFEAALAAEVCLRAYDDPGSGPAETGCSVASPEGQPSAGAAGYTLTPQSVLETPREWAGYFRVDDGAAHDAVLRAHGYGGLALTTFDGGELWYRPGLSFYDDWGIDPWVVPFVLLGSAPTSPLFAWASERAVAVGDLTGDGVDEIAVGHLVRLTTTTAVWAVTVLDARTGATLWWRTYRGAVPHLAVHDGMLVLAHETGEPAHAPHFGMGEPGTTSELVGLRFAGDGDGLDATEAWRVATGTSWARWLDVEPAGTHGVAGSFTRGAGTGGEVLLVDAATGAPRWQRAFAGYPRDLRHDPVGDRLVVHDQEPIASATYHLRSFALGTGDPAEALTRQDRVLLRMEVADLTGDGRSEWLTGEAEVAGNDVVAGHVTATDPAAGTVMWQASSQAEDLRFTHRLEVARGADGAPLVVGAAVNGGASAQPTDLRAYHAATGEQAWVADSGVFHLFLVVAGDGSAVLGATENHVVKRVRAADGGIEAAWPLLAYPVHLNHLDVTGDGEPELLVGTESHGVFALDPDVTYPPTVHWATLLDGPVRELRLADVTGDGRLEVVATTGWTGLYVLDGSSGEILGHAAVPGDWVWTATAADTTGDGRAELFVPTRRLTALAWDPDAGELVVSWAYQPLPRDDELNKDYLGSLAVAQGRVFAQWMASPPEPIGSRRHYFVASAVDAATGEESWIRPVFTGVGGFHQLYYGTSSLPGAGLDGGEAVVFTHVNSMTASLSGLFGPGQVGAVAYDAATGTELWRHTFVDGGFTHQGQFLHDGRLVDFNTRTTITFDAEAPNPVGIGADAATIAEADGTQAYVASWWPFLTRVWDASVLAGPREAPAPAAVWDGGGVIEGGNVHAFTSGAGTRVVASPFDWDTYATVAALQGVGVGIGTLLPHALVVLELDIRQQ